MQTLIPANRIVAVNKIRKSVKYSGHVQFEYSGRGFYWKFGSRSSEISYTWESFPKRAINEPWGINEYINKSNFKRDEGKNQHLEGNL